MHRVLSVNLDPTAATLIIGGDEAHHAIRVKRLQAGDPLEVQNGAGIVALCVISSILKLPRTGEWTMELEIREVRTVPPVSPTLEIWSATPKGNRLDEMIEGLSEVGAASWHPLETVRGVVDPRESKLQRLERIATESSKQCGRAWNLQIGEGGTIKQALATTAQIVVCDASGEPFVPGSPPASHIRVLVGPEGGWTPQELEQLRMPPARICRFGPHIMRIETAAVAAAAVILSQSSN